MAPRYRSRARVTVRGWSPGAGRRRVRLRCDDNQRHGGRRSGNVALEIGGHEVGVDQRAAATGSGRARGWRRRSGSAHRRPPARGQGEPSAQTATPVRRRAPDAVGRTGANAERRDCATEGGRGLRLSAARDCRQRRRAAAEPLRSGRFRCTQSAGGDHARTTLPDRSQRRRAGGAGAAAPVARPYRKLARMAAAADGGGNLLFPALGLRLAAAAQEGPALGASVYSKVARWPRDGTFRRAHGGLHTMAPEAPGRDPEPTAGVIDSQTARPTGAGDPARGDDGAEPATGCKRHASAAACRRPLRGRWMIRLMRIMVDTLGLMMLLQVHAADLYDRPGAGADRLRNALGPAAAGPSVGRGRRLVLAFLSRATAQPRRLGRGRGGRAPRRIRRRVRACGRRRVKACGLFWTADVARPAHCRSEGAPGRDDPVHCPNARLSPHAITSPGVASIEGFASPDRALAAGVRSGAAGPARRAAGAGAPRARCCRSPG